MKKIKFLVNVPDKYTREEYKEGQVKQFNNKRAEEILKARRNNGEPYAVEVIEKKETATVAAAPAEDLTDDTELVAVISAAIAASEGTTTEGFVVRSINRR